MGLLTISLRSMSLRLPLRLPLRPIPLAQRLVLCACLAFLLLSAAYVLQYLLGYQPCHLCLKQRIVWWALLVCAAAPSCLPLLKRRKIVLTKPVLASPILLASLCAALLALAGGTLAVFHAGGERGWWSLTLLCEGFAFDPAMTTEELRTLLLTQAPVSCDEPALRVFGLSLSEYNALFSFFVLGWLAEGLRRELALNSTKSRSKLNLERDA